MHGSFTPLGQHTNKIQARCSSNKTSIPLG
jgi:hypothetical protein